MNTLLGCHAARNMITIEETICPQCGGSSIEFFMRDRVQIADAICENCGFTIDGFDTESDSAPSRKNAE